MWLAEYLTMCIAILDTAWVFSVIETNGQTDKVGEDHTTSEGANMNKVRKYVQFLYSFMMEKHELLCSPVQYYRVEYRKQREVVTVLNLNCNKIAQYYTVE